MERFVFGISAMDPTTLITVAVVMTAIGLVACWFPAMRASRIAPSEALRSN
ncbi:hypothetical protein D3C83_222120 [compost metagenome]